MLVRFLSYAASVIGARRYKPLLISCLAVIFSVTGIAIVASSVSERSKDQASRIGEQAKHAAGSQQATNDLGGLEKKQTKDNNSSSAIPTPADPGTTPSDTSKNTSGGSNGSTGAPLEIILNSATISLSGSSPEAAVTVASNAIDQTLQWLVTPAPENAQSTKVPAARIEPSKDTVSAVVRIRSDDSTPGTYRFTITAKDSTRQLSASKTITVVVN
jgi:hypothetical protein